MTKKKKLKPLNERKKKKKIEKDDLRICMDK